MPSEAKETTAQPKPSAAAPQSLEELREAFLQAKKTTIRKDGARLDADTITSYEKISREFLDTIKRKLPSEISLPGNSEHAV